MSDQVRVRFAPSPTGHLHIGGLRSAIFNWLFAKHNNGRFLIRIEDTDLDRSTKEYTDSIVNSFNWIGIQSEEPIFLQTSRTPEHVALVDQLIEIGRAYRCFCSKKEYSELDSSYTKYDRTCLNKKFTAEELTKPHVIRFKLPDFKTDTFIFNDLIYGKVSYPVDQFDDFIILRSNGQPVYNFVVVADDIYQKITHIIRGQDHLVNTPKQIMLYQALEKQPPIFAHLPLILGPSGAKLSKREAAVSVLNYKEDGFLPDALFNYLVRLGWSHKDQEIFSRSELISLFDLKDVNRVGAIFDIKKLEWLNSHYIKQMSAQDILDYVLINIDSDFLIKVSIFNKISLLKLIDLYKERIKTLKELCSEIIDFSKQPEAYDSVEIQPFKNINSADRLKTVEAELTKLINWNEVEIANLIKGLCANINIKLPEIAKPLRLALTGKISSPGIFELIATLPKDEVRKRLDNFIKFISS